MRFTAQDALEASVDEEEPILVPASWARKVIHEHGATFEDFAQGEYPIKYDAWAVLEWLGY